MTGELPRSRTSLTADTEAISDQLARLAARLRPPAAPADPVLWAAAAALDTAELLLTGYTCHQQGAPVACRGALLEALGSARAAVGAVTHALRDTVGTA
ncbi:hypothetical protein P3102_18610 [Amycolatopsis sp. QT-25]|uniref:hypothetical protein n=1 Tax=Amycolatopsis sp. QT-25 TaxID=3034022 RepID=UPI0023ECDF30|nr:hypothetical protein [Amycolatopsis sp. QT-25]WET83075.1 hypothetical protein P3102_18610 [Amycolatopsis sp. QT-25]